MQQHEFNDEVVAAIARQNAKITRAFNAVTFSILVGALNLIGIAATITWIATR